MKNLKSISQLFENALSKFSLDFITNNEIGCFHASTWFIDELSVSFTGDEIKKLKELELDAIDKDNKKFDNDNSAFVTGDKDSDYITVTKVLIKEKTLYCISKIKNKEMFFNFITNIEDLEKYIN